MQVLIGLFESTILKDLADIINVMSRRRSSPLRIQTTEAQLCSIDTRLKIIRQLPFLQDLSEPELIDLNPMFHEMDFHSGEVICRSDDPAENLFVIAEGRVKLLHHSLTGREILLDLLIPGEFFGAISGLGGDFYPDTAQALSSSCILVIGRYDFQRIIQHHPAVALKVIDIMARRLRSANDHVHLLSALPVEGRIAYLLLKLGKKFGEQTKDGLLLQVPLSREDLAGMTATTVESASRVISQFKKDGLICAGRGWISLADKTRLENIAGAEIS